MRSFIIPKSVQAKILDFWCSIYVLNVNKQRMCRRYASFLYKSTPLWCLYRLGYYGDVVFSCYAPFDSDCSVTGRTSLRVKILVSR